MRNCLKHCVHSQMLTTIPAVLKRATHYHKPISCDYLTCWLICAAHNRKSLMSDVLLPSANTLLRHSKAVCKEGAGCCPKYMGIRFFFKIQVTFYNDVQAHPQFITTPQGIIIIVLHCVLIIHYLISVIISHHFLVTTIWCFALLI